jgi:arylsulfatase A-like enzyme
MPSSKVTLAELIGTVDYQTACIGKWDVSNRRPIVDRMPNAKGFDYYFGGFGTNDEDKIKFHENNEEADETLDMPRLTRMFTNKGIHYL